MDIPFVVATKSFAMDILLLPPCILDIIHMDIKDITCMEKILIIID